MNNHYKIINIINNLFIVKDEEMNSFQVFHLFNMDPNLSHHLILPLWAFKLDKKWSVDLNLGTLIWAVCVPSSSLPCTKFLPPELSRCKKWFRSICVLYRYDCFVREVKEDKPFLSTKHHFVAPIQNTEAQNIMNFVVS